MRVRSPVGDLPFTVTGVGLEDGELVLRGELGAWRSQVRVGPRDVPMLVRAVPRGVRVAVGSAAVVAVVAGLGGRARRGRRGR